MKISAKLPLETDMSVEDLIKMLSTLPKDAKVRGAVSLADRFGSDQYRLEINWEVGT